MADETKTGNTASGKRSVPLIGPNAARRKRVVELLHAFLEDRVSIAELQGISKEKLFLLAEAGYVKFKHGRVDEAEKIYQALIMLDHRNAYYHSVMGAIHQRRDRPVEAILEYSRAIQIDKDDISCFVNRGEIYLRHKNYRKAAEDFRQAIVMDTTGLNMWANRSRSLVIALKRSLEAQKGKRIIKRPERKLGVPKDAAARESESFPKPATPAPPSRRRATPKSRSKKTPVRKRTVKKK